MSLPSSLTDLYVGGNKFTSLSGSFPSTLKLLYVHDLPLKNSLADATLSDSIAYLYVQHIMYSPGSICTYTRSKAKLVVLRV